MTTQFDLRAYFKTLVLLVFSLSVLVLGCEEKTCSDNSDSCTNTIDCCPGEICSHGLCVDRESSFENSNPVTENAGGSPSSGGPGASSTASVPSTPDAKTQPDTSTESRSNNAWVRWLSGPFYHDERDHHQLVIQKNQDIYLSGSYNASSPISVGGETVQLEDNESKGAFVARLSLTGQWQWFLPFGLHAKGSLNSLAFTASNDLIIYGTNHNKLRISKEDYTKPNTNIFVSHLSLDGKLKTLQQSQASVLFSVSRATYDSQGNTLLVGVSIGSGKLGKVTPDAANHKKPALLIAQHSKERKWSWAKTYPSTAFTIGYGVDSNSDNIAVTGVFRSNVKFGQGDSCDLPGSSSFDGFFVMFDSGGKCLWAKSLKSPKNASGRNVLFTSDGVYVMGNFQTRLVVDSVNLETKNQMNTSFLLKFSLGGDLLWSKTLGIETSTATQIRLSPEGNIQIIGGFKGEMNLSPNSSKLSSVSVGGQDAFLAEIQPDGQWVSLHHWGGNGDDIFLDIAYDSSGGQYLYGYGQGPFQLGGTAISQNSKGLFVWKRK